MHKTSYENMKKFVNKYLKKYKSKPLKILDVGSQDVNGSYKPLFNNINWTYTGLDIVNGKDVDIVVRDIYNWKEIKSNFYDVVISGQSLEHIEFFWLTMQEIARTLKEKGLCCVIVPSSGLEHKYPIDCWRFFPDGLKALSKYVGLKVLKTYNCWNSLIIDGEENIWKDSVLICKKPSGFMKKLSNKYKFILKNE